MLTEISVRFADVSATSLGLALDLPPQPALDELRVDVGGIAVELRVLGASHQVIVDGEFSETVACLESTAGPLPERLERDGYCFASSTERLDSVEFRRRADALRHRAAEDPRSLAGVFPGSLDAITAMTCRPGREGLVWTTTHLYPRTREAVVTATRLAR